MKTFEEALSLLLSETPEGEEPQAKIANVDDFAEVEAIGLVKHFGIVKEIQESERARAFIHTYVAEVGPNIDFSVTALALSMFANGVIVGMEMNRVEFDEKVLGL